MRSCSACKPPATADQLGLGAGLVGEIPQSHLHAHLDLDASVARSWFVSFSGLRQEDPANPGTSTTTQMYASITWRF
jgi:hypothetical protein